MNIKKIIKDINTITTAEGKCKKCKLSKFTGDFVVNNSKIINEIIAGDWRHISCCVIYFLNQKIPIETIKQIVNKNLIFNLCTDKTLLDERKRNIINFFIKLDNTLDIE